MKKDWSTQELCGSVSSDCLVTPPGTVSGTEGQEHLKELLAVSSQGIEVMAVTTPY